MIAIRFKKDGQGWSLPRYDSEDDFAYAVLGALTGIACAKIEAADLTDHEMEIIECAGEAFASMGLYVGELDRPSRPEKPKLRLVK